MAGCPGTELQKQYVLKDVLCNIDIELYGLNYRVSSYRTELEGVLLLNYRD